MKKKIIAAAAAAAVLMQTGIFIPTVGAEVSDYSAPSVTAEKQNRHLAVMKTDGGIYLSWRLDESEDPCLGSSTTSVGFNVYRNNEKIAYVEKSTNYTDTSGSLSDSYSVAPVVLGVEGDACAAVGAFSSGDNYFDIALDKPEAVTLTDATEATEYTVGDCSTADLDGDGEYEIIVKWDCNPQDNSNNGYTGNVLLDAYTQSGEKLWRIDLGQNIRSGAHYTQFLVYDFDMDGKAELACKTAPGSKDSAGNYVSKASSDSAISGISDEINETNYTDSGGRVTSGAEYYTLFESDGTAADTIYYPYDRDSGIWGYDSNGNLDTWNRVDRYLGAVAYLDGVTPSIITVRGYYDRTTVAAYNVVDGRLTEVANFCANHGETYAGQGNHNITVADVDSDGKDEIITGSICWDDDLSVKWCSFRGHGDALHIGDYDPTHSGLEYFSVHESSGTVTKADGTTQTNDYGMTVYDAATGEELYHGAGTADTGRGVMANVGAGGYYQIWGSKTNPQYVTAEGNGSFVTSALTSASMNFRVFWDGDLYDELLDGTTVTNWNGTQMETIFSPSEVTSINGTKAVPALQADILGDWREELVFPAEDNTALRVFVSNIETSYKMKSLMQDRVYREGVAAEQTAYNQPPHVGFYMDEDALNRTVVSAELTSYPSKTSYLVGEEFDSSGIIITVSYADGDSVQTSSGFTVTGYDPYNAAAQTLTLTYEGYSFNIDVTVGAEYEISGSAVQKYTGTSKAITIPKTAGDTEITSIAADAISGADSVVIYPNVEEFGENAVDSSVTIICYEGSAADEYAKANGNPVQYITDSRTEFVNVDFNESEFDNASDMQMSSSSQSFTADGVTFGMGARKQGDDTSKITWGTENDDKYVNVTAGRFSNGGRNIYITLDGLENADSESDYALEMHIKLNTGESSEVMPQMLITTGSAYSYSDTSLISGADGQITVLAPGQKNMSAGTWYDYKLVSHEGEYYEIITDDSGSEVYRADTGISSVGTAPIYMGIYKYSTESKTSPASVTIDDIAAYSASLFSDLQLSIQNEFGTAVSGAAVSIGGVSGTTDSDGLFLAQMLDKGLTGVTVSASGYETLEKNIYLWDSAVSKTLTLTEKSQSAEKIILDRESLALTVGEFAALNETIVPSCAQAAEWSSDDEAVAEVDENGVVYAAAAGSAHITCQSGETQKSIDVTVVADSADETASALAIYGADEFYEGQDDFTITQTVWFVDENGVSVKLADDAAVEAQNAEAAVEDGIITVTVPGGFVGDVVVSASSGGMSAEKTIKISSAVETALSENFSDFEDGWRMRQQTESAETTINGITYHVGARSSGADYQTGFGVSNGYLTAYSGRFSDNESRREYLVINEGTSDTAALMMDLCFNDSTENKEITVAIGDGETTAVSVSRELNSLELNTWYKYILTRDGSSFTEYIISDGKLLSETSFESSAGAISKIDFVCSSSTNATSEIYIDNLTLTEDNPIVTLNAIVTADGEPVSGAEVTGGLQSAQTNEYGAAQVMCLAGTNTLGASDMTVTEYIAPGQEKAEISNDEFEAKALFKDGASAIYIENPSGEKNSYIAAAAAYGDDGTLAKTELIDVRLLPQKSAYSFTPSDYESVMLWDSLTGMLPVIEAQHSTN